MYAYVVKGVQIEILGQRFKILEISYIIFFLYISGPIKHISVNPADNSKILIGFDTGLICLWDLSSKKGDYLMCHFHENICIS